jgi:hypothetical protein
MTGIGTLVNSVSAIGDLEGGAVDATVSPPFRLEKLVT